MLTNKYINVIIAALVSIALIFTTIFMLKPQALGVVATTSQPEYVSKLFNKEDIMNINIEVDEDDWNEMLENAISEEYISGDVTINGTTFYAVGIRPKGNSSLSMVAGSDSDRFSFKFEFDHYTKGQTCFGLDKFVINNIQADATYMKEYLSYDIMNYIGVTTPLYSFTNVTVNGEPWGFYLAVEALEESFAERNFGTNYGMLYKPDSMNMAGGGNMGGGKPQGNRPEGNPPDMNQGEVSVGNPPDMSQGEATTGNPPSVSEGAVPVGNPPDMSQGEATTGNPPDMSQGEATAGNPPSVSEGAVVEGSIAGDNKQADFSEGMKSRGPRDTSGGGADLKYSDDNIDSYSDIFDTEVFKSTDTDYQRVIEALKYLNEGTELEKYINVDATLRYFAANTVLVNLDSYVSSMKHNYYLYEKDGQLTILPWDFNLAFGGFQSGGGSQAVNFPIDTPVSGIELSDRPLLDKLLEVAEYKERYHQYLQEIVSGYFNNGTFENTIDILNTLIKDYVKNDATAFYTYEQYEAATTMLKEFGELRAKSIEGQLGGSIPSTTEGQSAEPNKLIDASTINLATLGTQGGGREGDTNKGGEGKNKMNRVPLGEKSQAPINGTQQNANENIPNKNMPMDMSRSTVATKENIVIIAISTLALLIGTIFIVRFKRRKMH